MWDSNSRFPFGKRELKSDALDHSTKLFRYNLNLIQKKTLTL